VDTLRPKFSMWSCQLHASLDCLLAARSVGPTGRIIDVDMCENMVEKGRNKMADILLERGVTAEEVARKGSWSD
jgi:hypothetical protein